MKSIFVDDNDNKILLKMSKIELFRKNEYNLSYFDLLQYYMRDNEVNQLGYILLLNVSKYETLPSIEQTSFVIANRSYKLCSVLTKSAVYHFDNNSNTFYRICDNVISKENVRRNEQISLIICCAQFPTIHKKSDNS